MDEWKEHFVRLLGEVEERVVRGGGRETIKEEETEISKEKIKKTIRTLKNGKAAGTDGMRTDQERFGNMGERWK